MSARRCREEAPEAMVSTMKVGMGMEGVKEPGGARLLGSEND